MVEHRENTGFQAYRFTITYEEIEAGDYSRFDSLAVRLDRLGKCAYRSVYLDLAGIRHPWESLSAKEYVKGLLERCPHLFYYLIPVPTYAELLYCMVNILRVSGMYVEEQLFVQEKELMAAIMPIEKALTAYGRKVNDIKRVDQTFRFIGRILRTLKVA